MNYKLNYFKDFKVVNLSRILDSICDIKWIKRIHRLRGKFLKVRTVCAQ